MLNIISDKLNFKSSQCIQCAVCLASCPHDALSSEINEKIGQYDILINHDNCTLCDICTQVCPPNFMYDDLTTRSQIENAEGLYLGYSNDKSVRYESSTGGVGKNLIKEVLDKNIFDAVYTLEYNDDQSEIYGRWIEGFESFQKIPNSIYRPIMWGENLLEIDKLPKKVMLIGLPCQLKGAKKLLEKKRKKVEVFSIAIMCRQQKNMKLTRFYVSLLKKPFNQIKYRGEGWPGILHKYNISPSVSWAFWKLNGCNFCSDCMGAKDTDMTLADPWTILTKEDDPVGTNTIYVWSKKGDNLLKKLDGISIKKGEKNSFHQSMQYILIDRKERKKNYLLGRKKSIKLFIIYNLSNILSKIYENILMYRIVQENKYIRKIIVLLYIKIIRKIIRQ